MPRKTICGECAHYRDGGDGSGIGQCLKQRFVRDGVTAYGLAFAREGAVGDWPECEEWTARTGGESKEG